MEPQVSSLDLQGMAIPQNVGKITHLLMTPGHIVLRELKDEYREILETLIREMPETKFTLIVASEETKGLIHDALDHLRARNELGDPGRIRVADIRNTVWVSFGKYGDALEKEFAVLDPDNPHQCMRAIREWVSKSPDGEIAIQAHRDGKLADALRVAASTCEKKDPGMRGKVTILEPDEIEGLVNELSIWAQDSTLVVGDKLVIPERAKGCPADDLDVPRYLSALYPEYKLEKTDLDMEGGNVLPTPKTAYVGGRYLKSKTFTTSGGASGGSPSKADIEDLAARISSVFPRQKTFIFSNQPKDCFHIDMGMTFLGLNPVSGKQRVVVGDVGLARVMLRKLQMEETDKFREANAAISKAVEGWEGGEALYLVEEADTSEAESWLNEQARKLEDSGHEVLRVPFIASNQNETRAPWITYNNVLIHGNKIFMPVYGIPRMDDFAASVYENAGYQVVRVKMPGISAHWGALNCITKSLERSYAAAELEGACDFSKSAIA